MAEYSRPYPGTTIGDAGPYAAAEWWDCWLAQARSGGRLSRIADYNIGVFYAIANALEPTSNVTQIDVDTGASLIDGLYHENDATVSVPIPAAGAGDVRIDLIVVRKNYQQAVTYTPGGGAPTVGPREARITVIRGTEVTPPVVPAVPAMTQDVTRTTYWDIPLAQVEVDDGGNLSDFTDLREFVDAETMTVFVNPLYGRNITDGTDIYLEGGSVTTSYGGSIELPNNKSCYGAGRFLLPENFISDAVIIPIILPRLNSGDIFSGTVCIYGECGESATTNTDTLANAATAVTASVYNCINDLDLATPTVDDNFQVRFYRDATNLADTINDSMYLVGFRLQYFGFKK